MRITARVEGIEAVQKEFNKKLKRIGQYTEQGMTDITLDLMRRSQELAPKKEGDLRGSAYATVNKHLVGGSSDYGSEEPEGGQNVTWGEVGYGEVYALIQHENLDFNHTEGQAKYLEKPFDEQTDNYINHLQQSADDGWGD